MTVALPAIERDLGGGLAVQQWVSNAYPLSLASLILIGGSLGDIDGERRIFAIGVAAFGVVSLCLRSGTRHRGVDRAALSRAQRRPWLHRRRSRSSSGPFTAKARGGAIGAWTAWGGIAWVAGPTGWRVPRRPALVALDLRAEHPARRRPPWCSSAKQCPLARACRDATSILIGACLGAASLAGVVFALIEQPHYGWASPAIIVPLLGGPALSHSSSTRGTPQSRCSCSNGSDSSSALPPPVQTL